LKTTLLFTIYDLKQFYNCSLARAAKKLGVSQKKTLPKKWYKEMLLRLQDPRTRKRVLDYAMQDAATLQEIIEKTKASFRAAGINFTKPFSNATFSERIFAKAFEHQRFYHAEKWAKWAYHGGRIECLKCGFFRKAYFYDIHSAYPSEIAKLIKPDGKWVTSLKELRDDAVYAFVDCRIHIPNFMHAGIIPMRRRSSLICYPVGHFRKIVTMEEFKYLREKCYVERIYGIVQHCWAHGRKPFHEIERLYKWRQAEPAVDYAIKTILNALYGKLAQVQKQLIATSIVDTHSQFFDKRLWITQKKWKRQTSFVYAATVTANIRMRLIKEISPGKVIFYSTDGVMTTEPIPGLKLGKGLGEWDYKEVKNLIVVGSGVYTYSDRNGKRVTTKFRGFSPDMDLAMSLKKAGRLHKVSRHVLRNTSLKQAVRKEHRDSLNVLREQIRYLNVNFDRKRYWAERWNAGDLTRKNYESKPLIWYKTTYLKR